MLVVQEWLDFGVEIELLVHFLKLMTYIIEDGIKIRDIGAEKFSDRWMSSSKNPFSMKDNVLFNDRDYTLEHHASTHCEFYAKWLETY